MTARERLIDRYANLVRTGKATLEQVPATYREEVRRLLEEGEA